MNFALQLAVTLLAVLVAARAGHVVVRKLGQPGVVGEIIAGVLVGPGLAAVAGRDVLNVLLPPPVLGVLKDVGHAGLALFLVGVAHMLSTSPIRMGGRVVGSIAVGAFAPALAIGAGLACWVIWTDADALRGQAPTSSFVLLLAVSLAVTAVPVLARILMDRGLAGTRIAGLSLNAAVLTDAVAWLLLALALALNADAANGVAGLATMLIAGVALAFVTRRLLRTVPVTALRAHRAWFVATFIGATALLASTVAEAVGLTAVFGALVVGFAVPRDGWDDVVRPIKVIGSALVPVFFVVAGAAMALGGIATPPWTVIALVTVAAVAAKVGGTYLGARIAGEDRWTSLRLGALMNTRGLTEIVVLQAGYQAGILSQEIFLALLVMTLVTTLLTGPVLTLLDRVELRRGLAAAGGTTVERTP